ncbi:hypothetical protein Bhyg_10046, partial [Pseudolycoriella hygida]
GNYHEYITVSLYAAAPYGYSPEEEPSVPSNVTGIPPKPALPVPGVSCGCGRSCTCSAARPSSNCGCKTKCHCGEQKNPSQ